MSRPRVDSSRDVPIASRRRTYKMTPARRAHYKRLRALTRDPAWWHARQAKLRAGLAALHRDPIRRAAWQAQLRAGLAALYGPASVTLEDLLDRYVEMEPMSGCWIWLGNRDSNGYGRLTRLFGPHQRSNGYLPRAHRVVYEATGHLLLPGFDLHHVCHNRACCNPAHLKPMEPAAHIRLTAQEYWASRGVAIKPAAAPDPLADLVCLCGQSRGIFAGACCETAA